MYKTIFSLYYQMMSEQLLIIFTNLRLQWRNKEGGATASDAGLRGGAKMMFFGAQNRKR